MCHTWYFGDQPEDHSQVDSDKGDIGESNMIVENVINITCPTFISKSEHREDKFKEIWT